MDSNNSTAFSKISFCSFATHSFEDKADEDESNPDLQEKNPRNNMNASFFKVGEDKQLLIAIVV
ncbi:hypothetical protein LPB138_09160 [Urechidicola croceus]|uniref:Uncharacterized protein n=1 Tax=Urechidicola croceus TaxID=1850246 RepID=A0A1D8P8C9_9FLAO|nr:hypothetical protein LPB138_09160 [Urechidicola croceus]